MTRRHAAALATSLLALVLAGCAAPDASAPSPASTDAASPAGSPVGSATPTPDAQAVPTCETLIRSDLLDSLTAQGWTAETDTFRIGSVEVPDGLWCQWGDYSVASDHVQIYGWAPIDEADAAAARDALLAEGWQSLDGGYVTQDRASAFATDSDGYGMTYQFGDGWVTVSDTKQGLLVIERPAG